VDDQHRREAALRRLKEKRDFRTHVAVYLIVNAMLVITWAISGSGYFWPIWVIVGWGVGIAINAWKVYFERPITEADIQREIDRGL